MWREKRSWMLKSQWPWRFQETCTLFWQYQQVYLIVEEGWELRVLLTSDWYGQCICGWSKNMWKSLLPIFFHFHYLQTFIFVPLLRIYMIMGKETFRGKEKWNRCRDVKENKKEGKINGIFLFSILWCGVGKRMQREQHPHTPSVSLSRLDII